MDMDMDNLNIHIHSIHSELYIALDIGMHLREFAILHGNGDQVLEECWRRTWWQIYINDMYVASSSHFLTWKTSSVVTTVELPCEEHEYESRVSHHYSDFISLIE